MPAKASQVLQLSAEEPAARIGVVATTLAVLRLLASSNHPMGVNAIARELSLPPSSCFKILKQLQAGEFADFDPQAKLYSLGSGAIALARAALDPSRASAIMRPRMEEMAEAHSIALGLWRCIPQSRILLVGFVEGSNRMRIHMSVGQRLPMLMGAVGRAIAAQLDRPEADLRAEFDRLRWQMPVTFEDYVAQVQQARERGYAIDNNNFASGVTTVGVAIRADDGAVHHGLSGIMFSGQHDAGKLDAVGKDLRELARWASSRLIAS